MRYFLKLFWASTCDNAKVDRNLRDVRQLRDEWARQSEAQTKDLVFQLSHLHQLLDRHLFDSSGPMMLENGLVFKFDFLSMNIVRWISCRNLSRPHCQSCVSNKLKGRNAQQT